MSLQYDVADVFATITVIYAIVQKCQTQSHSIDSENYLRYPVLLITGA